MSFNETLVKSEEIRLFDMHCDTLHECVKNATNSDFTLEKSSAHVDLIRGGKYKNWVQVFATWIPDNYKGSSAFRFCIDSLKVAHDAQKHYGNNFEIVRNYGDISDIVKNGKCAAILAIENASALAGRIENLNIFSDMGVKLITLTWNGENELGYGCLVDKAERGNSKGLKQFGVEVATRMDELGMIPDVSHLNEAGFWDVMEHTGKPVVATHSVSNFVADHARNLRDLQFTAIVARGGIVGLNLCQGQLGLGGKNRSAELILSKFELHLSHFLSLGGENHVALGLDLDGTDLPDGWTGIENVYEIYNFLLRKNYQEKMLSKLFFDNSYDFFTKLA